MKKQSIWVFQWRKSVHYWWSYILFSPECKELTSMLDPLLYRRGVPPVVIRCVHWTMQMWVLQTWIKALGLYIVMVNQITPTNSLPDGEARVVWCSTPIHCGELMGAISLLYRPGTRSAGGLISLLFWPAFDHTFDHLQLIRATLIFKMQKDLLNKSAVFILIYFRRRDTNSKFEWSFCGQYCLKHNLSASSQPWQGPLGSKGSYQLWGAG